MATSDRVLGRSRRHSRVRRRVQGAAQRPRLAVFRSLRHIYAQVIDDGAARTVAAASTAEKDLGPPDSATDAAGARAQAAAAVGKAIAERARAKGVTSVVFDRGGYRYHGRVKALADAARAAGLEF